MIEWQKGHCAQMQKDGSKGVVAASVVLVIATVSDGHICSQPNMGAHK